MGFLNREFRKFNELSSPATDERSNFENAPSRNSGMRLALFIFGVENKSCSTNFEHRPF